MPNPFISAFKLVFPWGLIAVCLVISLCAPVLLMLYDGSRVVLARAKDRKQLGRERSVKSHLAVALRRLDKHYAKARRYYFQIRPLLRVALWVALIWVLLVELLLSTRIVQHVVLVGILNASLKLAMGYCTAFVFFYISTNWQRQADKEKIQELTGPLFSQLIIEAHELMNPVTRQLPKMGVDEIDILKLKLKEIVSSLKTYDDDHRLPETYINGQPCTVHQYILFRIDILKGILQEILVHYSHLDTSVIRLLSAIKGTSLLHSNGTFHHSIMPSQGAGDLFAFLEKLNALVVHLNAHPGLQRPVAYFNEHKQRMRELGLYDLPPGLVKHDPDFEWKLRNMLRKLRRKQ